MLLITSPRFEEHVTPPGHPERMERAQVFNGAAERWRELLVPGSGFRVRGSGSGFGVRGSRFMLLSQRTAGWALMQLRSSSGPIPEPEPRALLAGVGRRQATATRGERWPYRCPSSRVSTRPAPAVTVSFERVGSATRKGGFARVRAAATTAAHVARVTPASPHSEDC
jgi:hypothetical protein